LQSLTDEELVAQHDQLAASTSVGISYYLAEIERRRSDRQQQQMLRLTWVVTVLTVVNVAVWSSAWPSGQTDPLPVQPRWSRPTLLTRLRCDGIP
jgi:hypothetical protein